MKYIFFGPFFLEKLNIKSLFQLSSSFVFMSSKKYPGEVMFFLKPIAEYDILMVSATAQMTYYTELLCQ